MNNMKILYETEFESKEGIHLNLIYMEDGSVLANWIDNSKPDKTKESAIMRKVKDNQLFYRNTEQIPPSKTDCHLIREYLRLREIDSELIYLHEREKASQILQGHDKADFRKSGEEVLNTEFQSHQISDSEKLNYAISVLSAIEDACTRSKRNIKKECEKCPGYKIPGHRLCTFGCLLEHGLV